MNYTAWHYSIPVNSSIPTTTEVNTLQLVLSITGKEPNVNLLLHPFRKFLKYFFSGNLSTYVNVLTSSRGP